MDARAVRMIRVRYILRFLVSQEELKDEKFLSRLRRVGLPRLDVEGVGKSDEQKTQKGGKKGGKKGTRKG